MLTNAAALLIATGSVEGCATQTVSAMEVKLGYDDGDTCERAHAEARRKALGPGQGVISIVWIVVVNGPYDYKAL